MSDLEDLHTLREETYHRKLKENIDLKQKFLDTGRSNLSKFPTTHIEDDDEIQLLKREALSLYESLKTVPLKPQRDDLIGISLADLKVEEQVTNMDLSMKRLDELNNDKLRDIKYIESLVFNLNLLNNLIISKERSNDAPRLGGKSDEELDVNLVMDGLNERESKLISYLKEVVFKYLVDSNNNYGQDKYVKQGQYLKFIEDLLNNVTNNGNKFIEVPRDLQNDSVLRQLLVGHVILQRENFKFIRLNGFGL